MGLKVGCLAVFFHHHVTTMSVHMHAYHYPLSMKVEQKQICEQSFYAEKI